MKIKDFEDAESLEEARNRPPEQYEDDENGGDYEEDQQQNNGEVDGDMAFLDNQVNEVIRQRREEKEKAALMGETGATDNVDERLGEDFEDTPWVPPSVEVVRFSSVVCLFLLVYLFCSYCFALITNESIN